MMFRRMVGVSMWGALLAGFMMLFPCNIMAEDTPLALRQSIEQAIAKVKPALVRIHVVTVDYQEGREMKFDASGSGVIVTKEGHVVTNHHVAGHAARVFCTLTTKEEIEADVIGVDPLTDLAVVKLKGAAGRAFPFAQFGDSAATKVGDSVLAMGSPLALSQSVTFGIVSNLEMIMPDWIRAWGEFKQDGEEIGSLVKWIGHDAQIEGGNSGGPLVNLSGEIIGINEISLGLGGAIPGNLVKRVSDQLVANGKVTRAWLGFTLQARLKNGATPGAVAKGVLVSGVIADSPAAVGAAQSGDLLLRVGSVETNAQYEEELPDINAQVADLPIGKSVDAVVLRGGKEVPLKLTPLERPKAKLDEVELKQWGITVSDISMIAAREMKRKGTAQEILSGVLVTSVRPGGPAGEAKPSLADRDVIVEVGGKPVNNLKELRAISDSITQGKTEPVPALVTFERKVERLLTVVKVGTKEIEDPGAEVKKAWLPIETQVITKTMAQLLNQPKLTGFRVTEVYRGSTAEKAGLKVGDLITAIDETKMMATAPEHKEELTALVRQYRVGDTIKVTLLRGTQPMTLPVELTRTPDLSREMKEYRNDNFEFSVRDICFFDKAKEQWKDDQAGVLVTDVKPGGWAALGKLNVADLITAVNGVPVADVATFQEKMKALSASKPSFVTIQVLRGIYTYFVQMEPKWQDGR